mgnify:CR=1 FL=1
MAKLYFRYGAMGSSKSANALMVRYNYLERGKSVLLMKPSTDTRDGVHRILSRCGLEAECTLVEDMDLKAVEAGKYDCIIVDEAQFLTKEQVETFAYICDMYDVPVICYGLKTDFQGNFFEGSHWLLARADAIEEVKTICWCGRKAICNARVVDGKVVKEGDQILLGGSSQYVSLCRKHFHEGKLGK